MKTTRCERERAVLEALDAGQLTIELGDHVEGCHTCGDAVLVAQALREAAEINANEPLPDPRPIWRAAERSKRLADVERATRPITLMTRVALAVFVVTAGAGLVWMWPTVTSQVSATLTWFSHRTAIDTTQIFTAILGFASLGAFLAAFALFESWARE